MDTKSGAGQVSRRLPLVVAVINSNDDLVRVLRDVLVDRGFQVVTGHIRDLKSGRQDFAEFLTAHNPGVVIYDIAVPYEDNWRFLHTLRQLPEVQDRAFVITTVNKRVLDERIGDNDAIEIQGGHADDFDAVVEAVQKRAQARV